MKKILLNGVWDFALTANYETSPVFDSAAVVPGCFDVRPAQFSKRQIGHYRRKVTVDGGKVMLTLCGTGLHTELFWDGKSIGKTVLPYSKEEFIFDSGNAGEHTLEIVSDNFVTKIPGEQFKAFYDFYGYGGIYSDVYLTEFTPEDIRQIEVIPLSYEKGTVKIKVEAFEKNPETLEISFDNGAKKVIPFAQEFECEVPDFKLWSPNEPNLHKVTVNGREATFGIRILEWDSTQFKLNGEPLKLIGCNRHESHPETGAATPESIILTDLLTIRQQGFNFIRGSHYPQKEIMLDICDRIGLLVWEEALGWGNKPAELADETFSARQEEQCRKMVRKSINHPSVVIWGFLNECSSDDEAAKKLIRRLRSAIRELDTSRPVTFATNRPKRDICFDEVDILAINVYPGWYDIDCQVDGVQFVRPALEEYAEMFKDIQKPLIVSEIGAAAIYGDHSGCRWSEEYQSRLLEEVVRGMLEIDRYTGTALWLYCDSKTYIETEHFFGRPRGFNNKGMLNEYRIPKVSWGNINRLLKEKGFVK